MILNEYMPSGLLRPFIKAYRIVESRNELVNRVLPNTSLTIAFRFKGQLGYIIDNKRNNLPISTFSGLRKSVRLINYLQNTSTIIVLFKETGASAFFKEPLHELFEESVSLDNFITSQKISIIEERLAEVTSNKQRIAIIEQFLLSILSYHKPDRLISDALAKIHSTKGNIRVKELAEKLYISQDAFEKRFRKVVGTTPKQFSSIVRLNSLIYHKQKNQFLFDCALDGGYFDQPHFNKDFKQFTGQTPTDFFRSASFW
jgi:AraC-like DNA-binding protein